MPKQMKKERRMCEKEKKIIYMRRNKKKQKEMLCIKENLRDKMRKKNRRIEVKEKEKRD